MHFIFVFCLLFFHAFFKIMYICVFGSVICGLHRQYTETCKHSHGLAILSSLSSPNLSLYLQYNSVFRTKGYRRGELSHLPVSFRKRAGVCLKAALLNTMLLYIIYVTHMKVRLFTFPPAFLLPGQIL